MASAAIKVFVCEVLTLRVASGILPAMFLRSVHTFSFFLESNWSGDFGHAETGNGAKKRVVLSREFVSL